MIVIDDEVGIDYFYRKEWRNEKDAYVECISILAASGCPLDNVDYMQMSPADYAQGFDNDILKHFQQLGAIRVFYEKMARKARHGLSGKED